jgi:hypothetical protein
MTGKLNSIGHAAVLAALNEFVRLGRIVFLRRYGYGEAREYFVRHPTVAALCDSKAVVGAAYGFQFPTEGPLKPADFSGGDATVAHLLRSLGFDVISISPSSEDSLATNSAPRRDWSRREVEILVADYLQMLTMELTGQSFNKAQRRRALIPLLDNRTEASIEFKRRNVSAVMGILGYPHIRGYLPAENTQGEVLAAVVASQIEKIPLLETAAASFVDMPAIEITPADFIGSRVEPPERKLRATEPAAPFRARTPIKRDYLEREARNRSLGTAGEKFILEFERWRLAQLGVGQLADRVKHVAESEGDGLGYDVLSFEADGRERFIEVKTTAFSESTPFFVTDNEVKFARSEPEKFKLCRVYEFRAAPRFFELTGPVEKHFHLDPSTYRASLQ